jgi:hypothetical protein
MWLNILFKQPVEKLSITLNTILTHQEVGLSALGSAPPPKKHIPHRQPHGQVSLGPLGLQSRDPPNLRGDEVSLHLLTRPPRVT